MGAKKIKTCKKSNSTRQLGLSDIDLNRLMQTVEEIKEDTDKKLKEVSDLCLKRDCK
jgi:hypothetical protein